MVSKTMTREEALEKTDADMTYSDVHKIINAIYDDFEHRIKELEQQLEPKSCGTCKYWNSCVLRDLHVDAEEVYKTDISLLNVSCDKYEPKKD